MSTKWTSRIAASGVALFTATPTLAQLVVTMEPRSKTSVRTLSSHRFAAVAALAALTLACPPAQAEPAFKFMPGEVLVKLRPAPQGRPRPAANTPANELLPGAVHQTRLTEDGWEILRLPTELTVDQALARLGDKSEVEAAEPNIRYPFLDAADPGPMASTATGPVPHTAATAAPPPDDPLYPRLYGLHRIGAPDAWQYTRGTNTVVIAVFDTGVDYTHPELAPNMWHNPEEIPGNRIDDDRNGFIDDVYGANVVDGSGDPMDSQGHGTHVAGTIAAAGNNHLGVVGVNWNVLILAVRVARNHDGAFTGDLVRGLDYLTALKRRGVNLVAVNHSWGGPWPGAALSEAFARLSAAGVINVIAAGNARNDHARVPSFPSEFNFPGILSVAATGPGDHLTSFTEFSRYTVDVAAPGLDVWSTLPRQRYGAWSGTSMAAPHVTGAIGLLYALRPDLQPEEVRRLLMATVDPLPDFDRNRVRSGGRIHVGRAAQWLVEGKPLPQSPPASPLPALRMTAVSRTSDGFEAQGHTRNPGVSDDGRFVVFLSQATNLVPTEGRAYQQVFLADRQTGSIRRISQAPNGTPGIGNSSEPVISGDGRVVVFATAARNLLPGETTVPGGVFVWDRTTATLERANRPDPGQPEGTGTSPSVSRDGRRIVFATSIPLVAGDTNNLQDIYLRDRDSGTLQVLSVTPTGASSSGSSITPMISADGLHVAFTSSSPDLVEDDTNGVTDVFVRDLESGTTERVSVGKGGRQADGMSNEPRISSDGSRVAFQSNAGNLDPDATGGTTQVFLRSRRDAVTLLVSLSPDRNPLTGSPTLDAISADGRWVLFRCSSPRLPPFPSQSAARLFAYDVGADDVVALAYSDAGEPALRPPTWMGISEPLVHGGTISPDGRFVAFSSVAWNLAPGDGNRLSDVFLLDRQTTSIDLAIALAGSHSEVGRGLVGPDLPQLLNHSRSDGADTELEVRVINRGPVPVRPILQAEIGPDPAEIRWPPGTTASTIDPIAPFPPGPNVVRLPTLDPGASLLFSVTLPHDPGNDSMTRLRLAAYHADDGTHPSATSDRVTAMVTTPLQAPGLEWVSRDLNAAPLNQHAEAVSASADGSKVVFQSFADTVVQGDANESQDVFLRDRTTGQARVVSSRTSIANATDWSESPQISGDGRLVVFASWANNLGADANNTEDIFLKDLVTGRIDLVNRRGGVYGNFASEGPRISADGRFIAYHSHATALATNDNNGEADIFLYEVETRTTRLLSLTPEGTPANGDSSNPVLSADGRFVLFLSHADNLTAIPDTNRSQDVFLWDAATGSVELLSVGAAGAASGESTPLGLSDDGRYVILNTDAPDLPGGLTDGGFHTYLLDRTTGRFRSLHDWMPAASPPWEPGSAAISGNGEWLTLSMARTVRNLGLERLHTRVDLIRLDGGDRRTLAVGDRGPGAPLDGFSEVGLDVSPSTSPGPGRFATLLAEGREGRPFVRQAYLYDRARPAVDALAGRSPGSLRNIDPDFPDPVFRQLSVLVTPGQPRPFHLALRNTGDVEDALQLDLAPPGDGWSVELRPPANPFDPPLSLPTTFPAVPVQDAVHVSGQVTLAPGAPATPVEFVLRSASSPGVTERIRLTPLLDVDADGLADDWETTHFGNLTTASATSDGDSDGIPDEDEFQGGTDPKTANPPLQITRAEALADGRFRLAWPTVPGRLYLVETADSAATPFTRSGEPAAGSATGLEYIDTPDPEHPATLYRIRAELP